MNIQWTVDEKWDGELLRTFLREGKLLSKRALADVKYRGGKLLLNEELVTVRKTVAAGDTVSIHFPPEQPSPSLIAEEGELAIAYEDSHFLVINKEPGMATIPSRDHPSGTLANLVLGYYLKKGIRATFHAVNRLDKDTSGLLLVAKHRFAHDLMSKLQQAGKLERRYLAVVEGRLEGEGGTIDAPIGRKEESLIEREVRPDGQQAVTHYEIEKAFKAGTIVRVKLETGRTHQIRVHFSSIGHPLVGDDLYGASLLLLSRQALHSYSLSFYHPFLEKNLQFQSTIPCDIQAVIEALDE
nr:RluA family pseudouridine synthase [Halalkalibacterium ligniniphilum]